MSVLTLNILISLENVMNVAEAVEPKQRAHSTPKVPPAARPPIFMADMADGLAAGNLQFI
jgi:hypothetical protein